MKESKEDLSPTGQSRRRWIATSAALVAGSVTACGSESGGGSADPSCHPGEAPPAELPSFDAERCTDQIISPPPPQDEGRFNAWNEELRGKAGGRESALVDLDALDHNLQLVGQTLGSSIALRLVAKSLPSVRLLEYMMLTACTNRIMAFSEGMVTTSGGNGNGDGVVNLLSNQAEWLGARSVPLEVGDFIFYHPWEGDGVRWLARLDVFRGGELVDQWPTFQPGIRLA